MNKDIWQGRPAHAVWLCTVCEASVVSPWLAEADHVHKRLLGAAHRANEFSTGRALLRRASALYGVPVSATVSPGAHGKPAFPEYPDVHFNLSHALNRVVLTISSVQAVGVDIEHLDRQLRSRALAKRNCHPNELLALEDLDDESHRQAFLEMWVRKEAVLKARGDGVHGGPSNVDSTAGPGRARYGTYADWHLHEWTTDGYLIVIASGRPASFEFHDASGQW